MKTFQIIDSFLLGDAQSLLVTFARESAQAGHQMTVVSLFRSLANSIENELRDTGARLVLLPADKLQDRERLKELTRLIREERPDVVHTHLTYSNIVGSIAAGSAGAPQVATLHNMPGGQSSGSKAKDLVEAVLLARARRVIVVQHSLEGSLQARLNRGRLVYLPAAVEIPEIPEHEALLELRSFLVGSPSMAIIIASERLAVEKGVYDLLEAFNIVRDRFPSARLVLIGDGKIMPQVKERVAALGLDETVNVMGERRDVSRLLLGGDIHVTANHTGGVPVSLLNGMAAGLALVTTQTGDLTRPVIEQMGYLAPPAQPEKLAEALSQLLADQSNARQKGLTARDYAAEHFNSRRWASQVFELYRQESGQDGSQDGAQNGTQAILEDESARTTGR